MILYIYSKCTTCQKALQFLKKQNISFISKEIVATPPSVVELRAMLDFKNGNIKKLFNTSGQLYREMQLSEKLGSMSENESLLLLSQHGMLVKRPFLLANDFGLLGFKEKEWMERLSHK